MTSGVAGDEAPQKIFCIGLSRTGTSSLHRAFEVLEVPSAPTSVALMTLVRHDAPAGSSADETDHAHLASATAFTDNPVPFLYRRLDLMRPGSKFILTTRPKDEWLESMRWLFGPGIARLDRPTRRLGNDVHEQLYGIRRFDAAVLGRAYDDHHAGVSEYFADRSNDLLTVETATLDWQPLCGFIDRPVPGEQFPHANAATSTRRQRFRFFAS